MKISKKMRFFLRSQGSFNPKNTFLGQKVYSVACIHADRQTDTHVNTEDTIEVFQDYYFFPTFFACLIRGILGGICSKIFKDNLSHLNKYM